MTWGGGGGCHPQRSISIYPGSAQQTLTGKTEHGSKLNEKTLERKAEQGASGK